MQTTEFSIETKVRTSFEKCTKPDNTVVNEIIDMALVVTFADAAGAEQEYILPLDKTREQECIWPDPDLVTIEDVPEQFIKDLEEKSHVEIMQDEYYDKRNFS